MQSRSVLVFAIAFLRLTLFAGETAAECESELAKARSIAARLNVSAELQSRTKVGVPVKIVWDNQSVEQPGIPIYFMLTTPGEVRFSGTGFMAFTAGAKGPQGVEYGHDRARAFTPLHRPIDPAKGGDILVTFYRRGTQTVSWAIVTVGPCGEHTFGRGEKIIDVIPGPPEIVVQDRFADVKPVKRIRSPAGTHDLLVFDGRYEVYEVATGARIVDRPGIDPNFSPTGRFVAAKESVAADFEIVDLVTHQEVKPISSNPGSLVWLRNDSYVIMGHWNYSIFSVRNIIVDGGKTRVARLETAHYANLGTSNWC